MELSVYRHGIIRKRLHRCYVHGADMKAPAKCVPTRVPDDGAPTGALFIIGYSRLKLLDFIWCPGAELNHRHRDFQSLARIDCFLPASSQNDENSAILAFWSHSRLPFQFQNIPRISMHGYTGIALAESASQLSGQMWIPPRGICRGLSRPRTQGTAAAPSSCLALMRRQDRRPHHVKPRKLRCSFLPADTHNNARLRIVPKVTQTPLGSASASVWLASALNTGLRSRGRGQRQEFIAFGYVSGMWLPAA